MDNERALLWIVAIVAVVAIVVMVSSAGRVAVPTNSLGGDATAYCTTHTHYTSTGAQSEPLASEWQCCYGASTTTAVWLGGADPQNGVIQHGKTAVQTCYY